MDEDEFAARLLVLGFRPVERIPYGLRPALKNAWSNNQTPRSVLVQHFFDDSVMVVYVNDRGERQNAMFSGPSTWALAWEYALKLHQNLTGDRHGQSKAKDHRHRAQLP